MEMEARVFTIILSKIDIKPIYKEIRRACKGYDLPMYIPLEGGSMNGCYYLVATPNTFTPYDMNNLLKKYDETNQASFHKASFPKEHFNHHYEVSLRGTMGINLGKYELTKVAPIHYGDGFLQDTEEYKSLFDDL